MSKKEIEQLEKRIDRIEKCLELLEMETKELKSVDPGIIEERFKSIEETLYSTKIPSQVPNDSCSNEKEDSQEEQHWWLKSAWLSSGRTTWQVCNLRQGHQG